MESFKECEPGKICPARKAGTFPEECVCLRQHEAEDRRLFWTIGAVVTIIAAIALAVVFFRLALVGIHDPAVL